MGIHFQFEKYAKRIRESEVFEDYGLSESTVRKITNAMAEYVIGNHFDKQDRKIAGTSIQECCSRLEDKLLPFMDAIEQSISNPHVFNALLRELHQDLDKTDQELNRDFPRFLGIELPRFLRQLRDAIPAAKKADPIEGFPQETPRGRPKSRYPHLVTRIMAALDEENMNCSLHEYANVVAELLRLVDINVDAKPSAEDPQLKTLKNYILIAQKRAQTG
jgi:hypothetical protein